MRIFAGIDMSTTRQAAHQHTYVACLDEQKDRLHLFALFPLLEDADLIAFLTETHFLLCGIDAPLSLPPCGICRDIPCDCFYPQWATQLQEPWETFYHYRLCDILVRRTVPSLSPKPPLSNGGPVDITPLTMRWQRLYRSLAYHPNQPLQRIIEIYASGTGQLFAQKLTFPSIPGATLRTSHVYRAHFLSFLQEKYTLSCAPPLLEQAIESPDAFDAILSALSAFLTAQDQILQPEMLLGLTPAPAYVTPLINLSLATRQHMAIALRNQSWPRLPNVPETP